MINKISVIIPIYNGEKFILDTIYNIQNCSYKNIEIIAVNDGSIDNSLEVLKRIKKTENRLKIINKGNGGIASARNEGIKYVTGEYIAFCDQDDFVYPQIYNECIERIQSDQSEMAIFSTTQYDGRSKLALDKMYDDILVGGDIIEKLLYPLLYYGFKNSNFTPTIWKYIISTEYFRKHNFKFKSYIDYEDDLIMSIELLNSAQRVSLVESIGYKWNISLTSESHRIKYIEDLFVRQKDFLDFLENILSTHPQNIKNKYILIFKTWCFLKLLDNESSSNVKKYKEKMLFLKKVSINYSSDELKFVFCECSYKQIRWKINLILYQYLNIYFAYYSNLGLRKIVCKLYEFKLSNSIKRIIKI